MRERIATRARHLRKELFLERNRDPAHAALVLGSGRSGTTWLAEALARQHGSRLLFEPFHPLLGSLGEDARLCLDPEESAPALARSVERILAGRVRTPHIDQIRIGRLPGGRVVKDVHASNLLPWLCARFPATPVVYVVRHPIAAALSRLRADVFYGLGDHLETPAGRKDAEDSPVAAWLALYDRCREDDEPLVRLVAEWCLENVYPLASREEPGVALAFYETAVLDPAAELERLDRHCAGALGPARAAAIGDVRSPSAMDWRRTAADAHRSGEWERLLGRWRSEVPDAIAARCLRVVAEFGLDWLYGEEPLPAADPGRL